MARRLPRRREKSLEYAKELRREMTPAEQLVWSLVRADRLGGLRFRRQVPIGPFVADFYCHEAKLVLEVDGEVHDQRLDHDAERTKYLEAHGLRVFRISNEDVTTNLEGVGIAILRVSGVNPEPWLNAAAKNRPPRRAKRSAPSP